MIVWALSSIITLLVLLGDIAIVDQKPVKWHENWVWLFPACLFPPLGLGLYLYHTYLILTHPVEPE